MNPIKYFEFEYNGESYVVPREWLDEIRAEVIDEFAEEIKNLVYKWFESGVINVSNIDKIAEQLKENK